MKAIDRDSEKLGVGIVYNTKTVGPPKEKINHINCQDAPVLGNPFVLGGTGR